jgi:hypothetical protein
MKIYAPLSSSRQLYGLIHARYIPYYKIIGKMHEKFINGIQMSSCLLSQSKRTVGVGDVTGLMSVRVFCPTSRCVFPTSREISLHD